MASAPAVPSTMHVPVFAGEGRIDWDDKPVLEPAPGQLLVRVAANAVCGTDRLQYRFGSPVTPGHEAAGHVVAAGNGTSTAVGTAGVAYLMGYCGSCRSCTLGHTNQCLHKHGDLGFERDGGYGPYEVMEERQFFPVESDVDPVDATLLLDVMGTSGHAIQRAQRMRDDIESVVIAGAGPIGLGLIAMVKIILGQDLPVLVTDPSSYRRSLAQQLGATAVDPTGTTIEEAVAEAEMATPDVAFDATGREEPRREMLDVLGKRGVLVCVGHGKGLSLNVSPDLIANERTVMGSEYFRIEQMQANVGHLAAHRDYLAQIVTHRFPVADIVEGFELFMSGETGKAVVLP